MAFHVYILNCANNALYVGHTDNLEGRLVQHNEGTFGGYTASLRPVTLSWCTEVPSREDAFRLERQIEGWSRAKKLALIHGEWRLLREFARPS